MGYIGVKSPTDPNLLQTSWDRQFIGTKPPPGTGIPPNDGEKYGKCPPKIQVKDLE